MLRKLRLRVIIISMISVAAVLTVIIGSVNVLNYRNIIRRRMRFCLFWEITEGLFRRAGNRMR